MQSVTPVKKKAVDSTALLVKDKKINLSYTKCMEMAFKRNTDSGQPWLSLNEKFPKLSAINKVILPPGAFESEFYQWLQKIIQKYVENYSLHKMMSLFTQMHQFNLKMFNF